VASITKFSIQQPVVVDPEIILLGVWMSR